MDSSTIEFRATTRETSKMCEMELKQSQQRLLAEFTGPTENTSEQAQREPFLTVD